MNANETAFALTPLPDWALRRPKPTLQSLYDFIGAPLRMALLPDRISESVRLTSLRAERFAAVLPHLKGRVLDIGAGDNALLRLYRERAGDGDNTAATSVGLDTVDWGGGCVIVPSVEKLPFEDQSFDTVAFIACLNHIPERAAALREAHRVLKPSGCVVITMIGTTLGAIGHAIWWYSEDKHREVDHEELPGMDSAAIHTLLADAGFANREEYGFVYGLNRLYVGRR